MAAINPWQKCLSGARRFTTGTITGVALVAVVGAAAGMLVLPCYGAVVAVIVAAICGPMLVFGGVALFFRFRIFWNRPLVAIEAPRREGDQWYVPVVNLRRRGIGVSGIVRVGSLVVDQTGEAFPVKWREVDGASISLPAGERRDFLVVRLENRGDVVARWISYQSERGGSEFSCSDWDSSKSAAWASMERFAHPITIEATVQTVPDSRSGPIRASFELVGTELIKG